MPLPYPLLARFNEWANERLYDCVAGLSDDAYRLDRGAFFGSIHNTLNHLLVGDWRWMDRAMGRDMRATALDQILFDDFEALRAARRETDAELIDLAEATDEREAERTIEFALADGTTGRLTLGELLLTLANHQTHHRGQITCMLTQAGVVPPPLDIPVFTNGW